MTSSLSRNPVGLASGQYVVREGDQAAALQYTNGGDVPFGLQDAAVDRIPEVSFSNPGTHVSTRGAGRNNQEGVRRLEGSFLPVQQEPERCGIEADEEGPRLLDQAWPGYSCSGSDLQRQGPTSQDGDQVGSWTASSGQQADDGEAGQVSGARSFSEGEEETPHCFLDRIRICNYTCKAYVVGKSEPCKILYTLEKLVPVPTRPAPPAPKVGT